MLLSVASTAILGINQASSWEIFCFGKGGFLRIFKGDFDFIKSSDQMIWSKSMDAKVLKKLNCPNGRASKNESLWYFQNTSICIDMCEFLRLLNSKTFEHSPEVALAT